MLCSYKDLFKTLKKIPSLGGRVYPVTIPSDERRWPVCVIAKSGGQDLGTNFDSGARIPTITILIVDNDYDRLNDTMEEIIIWIDAQKLSFGLIDPPSDFYYERLEAYAQVITMSLQQ